ncbi:hypothetical protein niasHT_007911 [Heterodera trifolii]|uniref:Uncharacterized protein n=1 Tax=Heterodera trifolii TaxID=157864 RepID=A0ABD2LZI3_9BILA
MALFLAQSFKLFPLFLLCFLFAFSLADDSLLADNGQMAQIDEQQQDIAPLAEKRVPHPFGWRQPGTGRVRSSFHPMSMAPAEFGGRRFNRFYDYAAPGRPLFIRYMRNFVADKATE